MDGFVEDELTRTTPAELTAATAEGYEVVVGGEISHGELMCCVAEMCLEVSGGNACHCFNVGNLRGEFHGHWTSFTAGETVAGKNVILRPGASNKFRAYADLGEGMRDYLALLSSPANPSYRAALAAAKVGNFLGFVHLLKKGGYFTASEEIYSKAEAKWLTRLELLPQMMAFIEPHVTAARAA